MTRLLLTPTMVCLVFVTCAASAFGQFVTYSVSKAPEPIYKDALPACAPEDLRKVSLPNTTVDSVTVDKNVCRVTLTVTHPPAKDKVKVWVALPMKNWNGRLLGQGGMGFAGGVEFFTLIPAATGFVSVATDGGHDARVEGAFAMTTDGRVDWQSLRNFSHLAVHDMTVIAKTLTEAFYGKPPRYSYFCGLSNGGRQAMQAAQRYPEDYDGVISAAPAIQYGRVILTHLWPQVVMLDAKHTVSPAKLKAATAAVIEACDASDGAADGIIDDPIRCDWDPKALVGKAVGDSTFTEADADVIRKIWKGPRTHDGKFMSHGFPRGSDLTEFAAKPPTGGAEWVKYFLLQDAKWDWKTITTEKYELLFKQSDDQYASLFGAPPADLGGLRDRKGKLIIVQGMADQMVPPEGPIEYYEDVVKRMGGLEQVQPFTRLFLVPGVDHMMGGSVGLLDSLIQWVENGKAPEQITWKTKIPGGKTAERPVFPYPLRTVYQPGDKPGDKPTWVSKPAKGPPEAEGKPIPIWPGVAPGSEDWKQKEVESREAGETTFRNVTTPTLTAFLPDPKVATGAAVIVCPGGGFRFLSWENEGTKVAEWLRKRGVAAFVLKYRLKETPAADDAYRKEMTSFLLNLFRFKDRDLTSDAAKAIEKDMREAGTAGCADGRQAVKVVRERAKDWGIKTDRIGIMGFSAGGIVTRVAATDYDADSRPDFAAHIYAPVVGEVKVPKDAPPLFILCTAADQLSEASSARLYGAWRAASRPAELHVYEKGGHGFGMATKGLPVDGWIERFGDWLGQRGLIKPSR